MMTARPPVRVVAAVWPADEPAIRGVRHAVFSAEQGIDEAIDFDGRDAECVHRLALDADGTPVGTARLAPDGRIGRVAVLPAFRGRGIGSALVRALVDAAAARGLERVYLHSQAGATGLYEKLGFTRRGEPFLEAGIEHVDMARPVGAARAG